jgi:phosphinothricin acetyltransferase
MPVVIRLAAAGDAAEVAAIYAPYCESTSVSFETTAPTADEMAVRIATVERECPWLVLDVDGRIAGYAYASRHRERAAYKWAVDTAVYIAEPFQGKGVGRALYTTLFALLVQQGYIRACAGITLPNPASVRLHESLGFTFVGTYRRIGFKFGRWHDVVWYQLDLRPDDIDPSPPVPLPALTPVPDAESAFSLGLQQLRFGRR